MSAATMAERELTVDEVADLLRMSRNTVIKRIKQGELIARQEGREWRIRPSDLEAYRQSKRYDPHHPDR